MGSDDAAMFPNDSVTKAEAEAGPFADGFGGEERVKDFIKVFGGNSRAVIDENNADVLGGGFGADANAAVLRVSLDGLTGVV